MTIKIMRTYKVELYFGYGTYEMYIINTSKSVKDIEDLARSRFMPKSIDIELLHLDEDYFHYLWSN